MLVECYRILHPAGWLILWFSASQNYELVYRVALDVGFTGRQLPAIWVKGQSGRIMNPQYHLAPQWEPFYYLRKGPEAVLQRQGRGDTFPAVTVHSGVRIHPAERPIELMESILATFGRPGDRVLVPFLGSGNTLLAAANLKMPAWGYDLSETYKALFAKRVMEWSYPYRTPIGG